MFSCSGYIFQISMNVFHAPATFSQMKVNVFRFRKVEGLKFKLAWIKFEVYGRNFKVGDLTFTVYRLMFKMEGIKVKT